MTRPILRNLGLTVLFFSTLTQCSPEKNNDNDSKNREFFESKSSSEFKVLGPYNFSFDFKNDLLNRENKSEFVNLASDYKKLQKHCPLHTKFNFSRKVLDSVENSRQDRENVERFILHFFERGVVPVFSSAQFQDEGGLAPHQEDYSASIFVLVGADFCINPQSLNLETDEYFGLGDTISCQLGAPCASGSK